MIIRIASAAHAVMVGSEIIVPANGAASDHRVGGRPAHPTVKFTGSRLFDSVSHQK
jgi:hypothetical protein